MRFTRFLRKDIFIGIISVLSFVLAGVSAQAQVVKSEAYFRDGHTYFLLDENSSWLEAEAAAVSFGGHLVALNSEQERDWVHETFAPLAIADLQNDLADLWIGLFRNSSESWEWSSGEAIEYTGWCAGEPNHCAGEEYALMYGTHAAGCWNDVQEAGTGGCGGDYHTYAVVELPFIWPPTPDVISDLYEYQGHYYALISETSWSEAEGLAVSLGGHHVAFDSVEEETWVRDTFLPLANDNLSFGNADLWLGLHDENSTGWAWSSGEAVLYLNWGINQPDACSGEYFAIMYGEGGWNNIQDSSWGGCGSKFRTYAVFESENWVVQTESVSWGSVKSLFR